jgi:PII-like signaling protein
MRLSSVLPILLKIIDEQGKIQDADAQELLKIY